ncbi:cytoplasmic protein [Rariglobus hedericola]|uniref:Cytoplasmic protein n=1 Tax=Rariglobus hedericola TaxID=2597822 RepID=A0A556QLI5_9BACT|nr:cytoplasmic protein [Rariglobus hedericola]TSJ77520.1 cytoplasmic protein [Rariglobus hedericola]
MTIDQAILHSYQNRAEIKASDSCACFHCLARFKSHEIKRWYDTDDPNWDGEPILDSGPYPGMTAGCPVCENDSVIGSASGLDLNDEFLRSLDKYWNGSKK